MRLIDAAKAALEALKIGQDAFSQAFSGYGYYRPDNPHNFFPDPECCTPKEIAYHSAACEAYDKGAYVPDHSDGWITPELHVTKAPWGIGTYTDECKEITDAITALRAAIEAAEKQEPVAWMGEYNINNIRDHYTVVMRNKTDFDKLPERLRPLYTTPQPAIPAGWQLVPVEPTPEMLDAYMKANKEYWFEYDKLDAPIGKWCAGTVKQAFEVSYKSMLAAAPKPENSHD